jgi:mono/diheme cytochrome c family protein
MSLRVLNVGLAVAVLASLGVNWAVRRDSTLPNRDILPDMVRTVRYNAFAPNPNFADGKTLQRPEPGTIPHDLPPLHYQATLQDAARAGNELRSPLSPNDADALKRGTFLFATFCQPCHGQAGRGDGLVVSRGFPAPPALTAEHAVKLKDGQIFHILTYGQGNMASYASQLSREDRWKVVLFVRSLQRQAGVLAQGGQP